MPSSNAVDNSINYYSLVFRGLFFIVQAFVAIALFIASLCLMNASASLVSSLMTLVFPMMLSSLLIHSMSKFFNIEGSSDNNEESMIKKAQDFFRLMPAYMLNSGIAILAFYKFLISTKDLATAIAFASITPLAQLAALGVGLHCANMMAPMVVDLKDTCVNLLVKNGTMGEESARTVVDRTSEGLYCATTLVSFMAFYSVLNSAVFAAIPAYALTNLLCLTFAGVASVGKYMFGSATTDSVKTVFSFNLTEINEQYGERRPMI